MRNFVVLGYLLSAATTMLLMSQQVEAKPFLLPSRNFFILTTQPPCTSTRTSNCNSSPRPESSTGGVQTYDLLAPKIRFLQSLLMSFMGGGSSGGNSGGAGGKSNGFSFTFNKFGAFGGASTTTTTSSPDEVTEPESVFTPDSAESTTSATSTTTSGPSSSTEYTKPGYSYESTTSENDLSGSISVAASAPGGIVSASVSKDIVSASVPGGIVSASSPVDIVSASVPGGIVSASSPVGSVTSGIVVSKRIGEDSTTDETSGKTSSSNGNAQSVTSTTTSGTSSSKDAIKPGYSYESSTSKNGISGGISVSASTPVGSVSTKVAVSNRIGEDSTKSQGYKYEESKKIETSTVASISNRSTPGYQYDKSAGGPGTLYTKQTSSTQGSGYQYGKPADNEVSR